MQLTLRARLAAIVAVNAFALIVLVLASWLLERRVDHQLQDIQDTHLPRIGLQPRLERAFDAIGQTLEDAATAGDAELLDAAADAKAVLLAQIADAGDTIPAQDAATLRAAIDAYYAAAADVSRQMIASEGEADLSDAIEDMQAKQAAATAALELATRLDDHALARAFTAAADAQRTGDRVRLIAGLLCLIAVVGLSIWVGRSLFGSVRALSDGFRRFGRGDLSTPIPSAGRDELGELARQANQMASQLQTLGDERDREAWLKTGQATLSDQLRGEMEPSEVADRVSAFVARYLGTPAAALYYATDEGDLALLGRHGFDAGGDPARFAPGEGLIGQAALCTEITIVHAETDGALRLRAGMVDVRPKTLVLVPLIHAAKVRGVLELPLLGAWTPEAAALVEAVRESIAISIEVARARAASRDLLAETQRQARELLDARERLEQKAAELTRTGAYKSQFLASMSHELRTPLNAIIGFSELLHDGVVPPPQQPEFLGQILASAQHLLQLINDVLDLSKVESGKLEFHPVPAVLSKILSEVLGILRTSIATAKVKVEVQVAPEIDEVVLDPARLKQVLYNYLSNALKFTPKDGRVDVRITAEGADAFRIEVQDTGVGIAPVDLARLFAEFQQVGDARKQAEGTGLGLALTKRLVEAQGGSVGVRSTIGKGSVFHAILPRRAHAAPRPTATRPVAKPSAGPVVLVVEDDAEDQRALADALARAGYAVELATTGAEALARCAEHAFDAITLDLLLPDMTGLDVLRQIRGEGANRDVPVIVITVVAERGAVAGFAVHDVLPKPLDADVLLASLLRASVAPDPSQVVMVVDDDPAALQLMSTALHQLGYRTRCVPDGEAALRATRAAVPSAIVLDLLMPGMSGFEFLDRLPEASAGRAVPVIVWTSKDLTEKEHAMLRASASAVVTKGGGSARVVEEITAHLPRGRA